MEGETVEHVRLTSKKIDGDRDVSRVESDIASVNGVRNVNADANTHTVEVVFDPREVSLPDIQAAMEAGGYDVESTTYGSSRDDTEADQPTRL